MVQVLLRADRLRLSVAIALFLGASVFGQRGSISGPTTDQEIRGLVRDLGDPVYAKREFATRRLCAIGTEATGALRDAAKGDDIEAALRAKGLLSTLDQVWFSGVEVQLDVDRRSFGWDEAIDLIVTFSNRSTMAAKLPFETDPKKRAALSDDARQVSDMLDVSEWLRVHADGGREIELRVDNVADDSGVLSVVHQRLDDGPLSLIPPGGEVVVRIRAFNRGWARYRLLDAGEYSVVLNYAPAWQDPVLAAQDVGRVTSNLLHLTVTRGAPETVSRGGAEAEVTLRRDGDTFAAELTNRTDQAILVNLNFGVTSPFAEGRWVLEREGRRYDVSSGGRAGRTWADFEEVRLRRVEAGAVIELSRIGAAELGRAFADAGMVGTLNGGLVTYTYSNLCDRRWQIREETNLAQDGSAPAILKQPLPRHLLSARLTSNTLSGWGER